VESGEGIERFLPRLLTTSGSSSTWNPEKELKGGRGVLRCWRRVSVESGEGIESLHGHRSGPEHLRLQWVESGEGIERVRSGPSGLYTNTRWNPEKELKVHPLFLPVLGQEGVSGIRRRN